MVLKNLLRRKGRTLLTVLGISIGVAAIIGLGAMAEGIEAGYESVLTGSKADLILSQPDAFDVTMSAVDEEIGQELRHMPEVADLSGMLQGFIQAEDLPFFFVFGYPEDSFILERFQIVAGHGFSDPEAQRARGKPMLLGSAAAESLDRRPGDSLRLVDSVYTIVGIYQTGDGFEDSGGVLRLEDAQQALGKPRTVSLFYIQLEDLKLKDQLMRRVDRKWPDLSLSTSEDYSDRQLMGDFLRAYVWVIAGLAIVIGGVGMMNTQLMAVFERTREIGVLRSLGWSRRQVLSAFLAESLAVGLAGGVLGVFLGVLSLGAFSDFAGIFGASAGSVRAQHLVQAGAVVLTLGMFGGLYPAWRAAQLQPVEALRHEGGASAGKVRRVQFGGLALQSLLQRATRTSLTLLAIGLTVGSIMALEAVVNGAGEDLGNMAVGNDVEVMVRQADIADTSMSALDERIGDKFGAMQEVRSVSGMIFTAVMSSDGGGFFLLFGYAPNEFAIQRFNVVEGQRITSNHQIMLGKDMAESLNKDPGDTMELSGMRLRVVGIYESSVGWEELGGIVSLRDAQAYTGRPNKVTMYGLKLEDPRSAPAVVEKINRQFPSAHASISGEFVDEMPDMQSADAMIDGISALAIMVGGVGVLNTMLMAVLERTREIGVLRALGWRRRRVLLWIIQESLLLSVLGGILGVVIAFGLVFAFQNAPLVGGALSPGWDLEVFTRAIAVAVLLGFIGGMYPAYRATRLQPVEAIRYE
jgi:ABC-type lipoprotein release transport system permease subunit